MAEDPAVNGCVNGGGSRVAAKVDGVGVAVEALVHVVPLP